MRKSSILKIIILGILIYGSFLLYGKLKESKDSSFVRIGKVERIALIQRVTIAGNIEPLRKTIVTAPFSGYVKKLFVKIGDKVKKGQPIVSITQSLQSRDPVFPLRSPFDGTVVSLQKQEGEFVQKDDTKDFILRIDSLKELYINSNVPEIDMVKISPGLEAVIKASAILDKKYKGEVVTISLASNSQDSWRGSSKVEYPTRIKILNPDDKIKPGMSTILDIITMKKENVLALAHEFVSKEESQYFVFRENGEKVKIKIGVQNESHFEILEGLNEGDRIKQVDFLQLLKDQKTETR